MFWKDRSIDRQNFGDQILLFLDFFSSLHFASFCGGIKTYSALTERIFFVISVLFRLFSAQTLNREATAMFCSSKGPGKYKYWFPVFLRKMSRNSHISKQKYCNQKRRYRPLSNISERFLALGLNPLSYKGSKHVQDHHHISQYSVWSYCIRLCLGKRND